MKKIAASLLLILSLFSASAQQTVSQYRDHLLEQANDMGWLLVKKEYSAFVEYIIPSVVRVMGGKSDMTATIRKEFQTMEDNGYRLVAVNFEDPETIIDTAGTLQCILPEKQTMNGKYGDMVVPASMLALSKDNGRNWRFVELSPGLTQRIKTLEPAVSPRLLKGGYQ